MSFNKAAWKGGQLGTPFVLAPPVIAAHRHSCMGTAVKLEGLPWVVLTTLSALTGGTARRTQTHPPLSLHGVARPWSPGDHPVPDPVCENCQGLHQQDAWCWAHRGALQVLGCWEPVK